MNQLWQRILCSLLALSLIVGTLPAVPAALAAAPATLSLQNNNIEVIVSTENGGFLVRTLEGDVLAKDDNNKDLLYHRDQFDTSFASFVVTQGGQSQEYVFGNDYGYKGWPTALSVTKELAGIRAVWSVKDLVFTQLLEPISNEMSNEHGTVLISYAVQNLTGAPVEVKARLLLDTALGEQDHAYYELAQPPTADEPFRLVEQELSISEPDDYLPPNFFAYDNYANPTMAAYTIFDQSPESIRPYRLAFGHWNNLAATVFDFVPDGGLTFTNPYNRRYLTADSAFAIYYNLGSVAAGDSSSPAATYYGVDSKVRVKDSDRAGVTITAPPSLVLNAAKTAYLEQDDASAATGIFEVTTNITNLAKPNAGVLSNITVAVLVDDGLIPLDGGGHELEPLPTNLAPHTVVLGNLLVGTGQQLTWKFRADVQPTTSYRKLVFRVYDTSGPEGPLVLDNLIGSATTYVLCPGGDGALPEVTFTGMGPLVVYNQGIRHLYLTGTGFGTHLSNTYNYQLLVNPKNGATGGYTVPRSNIIYSADKPGVLDVVLEQNLQPGEYELIFQWEHMTAFPDLNMRSPALSFLVTEDPAYRNDYYSVVAVVKQGSGSNLSYHIKPFATEAKFQAESPWIGEVLLEFRGKFVLGQVDWTGDVLSCSAVASTSTDTITVNGALDFEHGNLQIYRIDPWNSSDPDGVIVEFNGDLYTTSSRTSVWSGNATLTPLMDKSNYGLIKYNQRGERVFGKQPQNIISLVWPSGYNMLQTIGGFAVDFRYGQFGAMYEDDACTERTGYVVSFGGKLDLSFLMPGGNKQAKELEEDDDNDTSSSGGSTTVSPSDKAKAENEQSKVKPAGKVNIEDVLFGNGDGYLGFNSLVELMLPKYVAPLPAMGGKLAINTIGGYKVGVLGKAKTKKFDIEFELKVINAPGSNAPIPDKLFFYIAGFEPGVNIDGAGGFWLTGGGGGIDRLYDTIFKSGVPPLTLLLAASFDIVKVMSGRADLSLSLRGFQMKLTDVKLKNTDKVVLKSGTLGVEWEPDLYLQLSAMAEILETIEGRAYLVVDDDFFEMFLRASVKIPKDVKILGGMTVANADLGGNNDKIWGTVSALGTSLGVTYYWGGGGVQFGSGTNTAKPTYPELLGLGDLAVGLDPETGETLYLHVGTNLSEGLPAQLVDDSVISGPMLLAFEPSLTSTLDRLHHTLDLAGSTDDAALAIRFSGQLSAAAAAAAVQIFDPTNDEAYPLTFYNGSNPNEANANLVVADDLQSTTIYVTFTDHTVEKWQIETAQAADIVLYMIGAMPQVTSLTATAAGDQVTLDWTGAMLDETAISCYITDDIGGDQAGDVGELGRLIGNLGGTNADGTPRLAPAADGQSLTLDLPADLPSGDYYLRLIVRKEDQVNQNVVARNAGGEPLKFTFVNGDQPAAPGNVSLVNCGDGLFRVQVGTPPIDDFDGYNVNIYQQTADGPIPTDFIGIPFAKDEAGALPEMLVGGRYVTTDGQSFGLEPGKVYLAEVSAYKVNDGGTPSEDDDATVFSPPALSAAVQLRVAIPPSVSFLPQVGTYQLVTKTVRMADDSEQSISIPTFTQRDVQFTLRADVPVSGYWSIDGVLSFDPSSPDSTGLGLVDQVLEVNVSQELCEGEHSLSFIGEDAEGDSFVFSQLFAVDSMPPRLMLTSPVNGGQFKTDGTLLIQGIGDEQAVYTILVDGVTEVDNLQLTLSPAGVFSYTLQGLDVGVVNHQVTVVASDALGNSVSSTATVSNGGLAMVESVNILLDGVSLGDGPAERNIDLSLAGRTAQLSLVADLAADQQVLITDERLVRWTAVAKVGTASVDPDGMLSISPGSIGYVLGEFRVAEGASLESAFTFGAENYNGSQSTLVVTSTVGGSANGSGNYLPAATVTITALRSLGYRFVGWNSSNGGSFGDASATTTTFTMPDDDTVVTATFELDPSTAYRLSFDSNGGTAIASQLVAPHASATQPVDPARDGHVFGGWFTDSDLTTEFYFADPVTSNLTLYADWYIYNYTVVFQDWDEELLDDQIVDWHTDAIAPENPSREGYTFIGWDQVFDSVEADLTITACYEPNYTVSFDSHEGSAVADQTVVNNQLAQEPAVPTKAGHNFTGWFVDSDLTTAFDFAGTAITGDVTLYAKWDIYTYHVVFAAWDGAELKTETVNWHTGAVAPAAPSREGYTFAGWDKAFGVVTADLLVTATYQINIYTVTFDSQKGSAVASVEAEHGSIIAVPTSPTRAGYDFGGWYVDSAFSSRFSFSSPIVGALTLYALWFAEDDPTPRPTVISGFLATGDDRRLDEALRRGFEPLLDIQATNRAELSIGVISAISQAGLTLSLQCAGVRLDLPPNWLDLSEMGSQATVQISARQLDDAEQQALPADGQLASKSGRFTICGQVYELLVELVSPSASGISTNRKVEQFGQPVAVTMDLGGFGLSAEEIAGLTGTRLEEDAQGNLVPTALGGAYDAANGAFTFRTERFSQYALTTFEPARWVIILSAGNPQVVVSGEARLMDVAPLLHNSRIMVPVRFLAETMGATVSWLAASSTVIIRLDGQEVRLTVGELDPVAGLDVPATILNGRTMVPLRYISESLGAFVAWSQQDNTVEVVKP